MKKTVVKKMIAVIAAIIIIIGIVLAVFGNAILYPSYEKTQSIEFAQKLGTGWNLGNTFDACDNKCSS